MLVTEGKTAKGHNPVQQPLNRVLTEEENSCAVLLCVINQLSCLRPQGTAILVYMQPFRSNDGVADQADRGTYMDGYTLQRFARTDALNISKPQ